MSHRDPSEIFEKPVNAYLLDHTEPVAPWNEPAHELEVFARPLGEWMRGVLESEGFTVTRVASESQIAAAGPCLVVASHVVAGSAAIRAFKRACESGSTSRALALPDCAFTRFTTPLAALPTEQRAGKRVHRYDVFWCHDGRFSREAAASFEALVIEPRERELPTSAPPFVPGERMPMGITPQYVFQIRHWSHLHQANIVGGICEAFARATRPRTWAWLAWRVLRAFPWTLRRLLGGFNHRGRRSFIHPTASVEGCVIGRGVVIDAGAVVRGSIVGDGAKIGQHARVLWSVIGPGARVAWNGIANFSVLMRGAETSFPGVQMSVVGRDAYLGSGVWHLDTSFTGPVPVRDGERVVASHQLLLGIAVGHRGFLGAGVTIAAGREIPNGTRWIDDPARMATRIPADLVDGEVYAIRDGRPILLSELLKKKS